MSLKYPVTGYDSRKLTTAPAVGTNLGTEGLV
jgi:hypothetical protein